MRPVVTMHQGAVGMPWRMGCEAVRSLVPPLSYDSHKGQAGRIGVIGGSVEYTGAPYYAASAALQVGGDLSWVFTADDAALAIKTYSPELIVVPVYKASEADQRVREAIVDAIEPWLDRLHGVVVGPGLGRREGVMAGVGDVIRRAARDKAMPVVIDADGLHLVTARPELIAGCSNVVLTPNKVEFDRLRARLLPPGDLTPDFLGEARELVALCDALGGVTIVKKGKVDLISDGGVVVAVADEVGCPRRCGGIGDVLAGCLGVFAVWAARKKDDTHLITARDPKHQIHEIAARPIVYGAYAAAVVARRAAQAAFKAKRRAMTAPDVLRHVAPVFEDICPTVVA